MSILDELKAESYRIGDLQALPYDRNNPIFGEMYLPDLYLGLGAGRRTKFSRNNLRMLFCGFNDLSLPAIVSYLAQQKLVILGKWEGNLLRTGGVCWATAIMGTKEKSAFGGYGFLRWIWGTEEQFLLGILGLSYMFQELDLVQLHGQRYASNHLTANFMARFGFRDVGTVPKLIQWDDHLEDGVISTVERSVFESVVIREVLEASRDNGQDDRRDYLQSHQSDKR